MENSKEDKVVKLREVVPEENKNEIQVTPVEAWELSEKEIKDADECMIIVWKKGKPWSYRQGGGLRSSDIVWRVGQILLEIMGCKIK